MSQPINDAPPVATPPPAAADTSLLQTPSAEGETITAGEGEYLLTPDLKGQGDVPEWFKSNKYKTVQAQAEAYGALESKFGSFTGAPDEYELNVPEGLEGAFESDDPLLVEARTMFKEMGVNQEGFDKIMGLYLSGTTDDPALIQEQQQANVVEVLGQNHQQVISQVSGYLSNLLGPEGFKEVAPLVTNPDTIKAIEAVMLASAPKVAPINDLSNPDGITMVKLNEMRSEVIADGPHKGQLRWHKDPGFRAQVQAYSSQLHGAG